MDLLEYQAKALFREVGIPVLPSQRIDRPQDLKGLRIPYPVVLKSQVYIGGRGRVGGVKFVQNTIDAIAAAQAIFNLPIMGEYPKALLAEAKYNAEQEFYLAVVLNRSIRRPVLLGSQQGGVDVQAAIDRIQHVVVEQAFSPYYARRLVLKMGLEGKLINLVSDVIEKMYQLFVENDLDLVEINPLGVNSEGNVMALDGKVTVNDNALDRHPELAALLQGSPSEPAPLGSVVAMEPEGSIGILCNGAGLTMATMDLVYQAGGNPASFLNIGGETRWDLSPDVLQTRLAQGLDVMTQSKQVRVLLVNLVSGSVSCVQLAEVIVAFLKRRVWEPRGISEIRPDTLITHTVRIPQLVVRLVCSDCGQAKAQLAAAQVSIVESLDDAVAQAVTLAKSLKRK
ncbi:acetate--CoA ligase family protein [Leptolyngbya sp. FACHB-36]|uniref:ATP-grasp domain-containing protein n=1 Tax=Leptolyngbya sp. FACHB-36 TaxID=2692808 RepID=UPI001680B42A|nr:acetate--CoA ligase family protein [Leptolyngbya sp. FACHB-36]